MHHKSLIDTRKIRLIRAIPTGVVGIGREMRIRGSMAEPVLKNIGLGDTDPRISGGTRFKEHWAGRYGSADQWRNPVQRTSGREIRIRWSVAEPGLNKFSWRLRSINFRTTLHFACFNCDDVQSRYLFQLLMLNIGWNLSSYGIVSSAHFWVYAYLIC